MNLTVGQLEELYYEEEIEVNGVTLTTVEEGEWVHDHKWQHARIIFTDGEKHYAGSIGRSGSEFTEWVFESELFGSDGLADITEVEKREVVTVEWAPVK